MASRIGRGNRESEGGKGFQTMCVPKVDGYMEINSLDSFKGGNCSKGGDGGREEQCSQANGDNGENSYGKDPLNSKIELFSPRGEFSRASKMRRVTPLRTLSIEWQLQSLSISSVALSKNDVISFTTRESSKEDNQKVGHKRLR